ncbi:hypothetical protein TYRP_014078 [Tyrophagus putrescentiae]|nr:hypothetical protein TYRP_014078 [Tyrophagus putrescentiae]
MILLHTIVVLLVSSQLGEGAESLSKYNVDIKETSVSGISSGGYFAVQMQVAFSSFIKGAGIVAGGPYDCGAEHLVLFLHDHGFAPGHEWTLENAFLRVYLISGSLDVVVQRAVVNQLYDYYVTSGHLVAEENVHYNKDLHSGHTFPTDFSSAGDNACSSSSSPFISNCEFDGAGAILRHIYGNSLTNRTAHPAGKWITFKQTEFAPSATHIGLAEEGYLYVPKSCASGAKCRLHIAFHGCAQNYATIGSKFLLHTGFDRWADNNHLLVLFPQTKVDYLLHLTPANGWLNNANGCWDWMGMYGSDFSTKSGVQMATIRKMIERITGH